MLRLYNGPTFSKWPKEVGVLVHSTKSLQNLVERARTLKSEVLVQRMMLC